MTFKDKLRKRAYKESQPKVLGKLTPYDIIIKPIINKEKAQNLITKGQYIFQIHKDASKNDVKKAIKIIYNVDPIKVNTLKNPYKGRSNRKLVRRETKKAIIFIKEGDKIELIK